MALALICIGIGIAAGVSSGLFGIGGGIILVPAMIYLLGFSQKRAQGTSLLALLLPVGILAVYQYWKQQQIDFVAGGWIVSGFLIGSIFGSKLALNLPEITLRRIFAAFLVVIAIQLLLKK